MHGCEPAHDARERLPSGRVLSLQTVLSQSADRERVATTVRKLREKCTGLADDRLDELETRFRKNLYLQGLTPSQWYRRALAISEEVLNGQFAKIAGKVSQVLFVGSRFHFAEEPEPEILRHYETGETIPANIANAPLSPDAHTMRAIPAYLHNRLGTTILQFLRDPATSIEVFIGSREDMVAYYRSTHPPLSLKGELESPTSTEFYLFQPHADTPTVVLRGISNPSRFRHQLWQLRYAGIDCARLTIRGTFQTALVAQLETLRRELAKLPVKPTVAVMGQRWWPMEIMGTLTGISGREGEAYDRLRPTQFRIGSFTFDYLIARVAGAPPRRNKVGIVAFRMPNGSLAGDAMQALLDNGTTHVLSCGAGGSLDARSGVGSYQVFTEALSGDDVYALPQRSVFMPELPEGFPAAALGRNVTVDSPLEETNSWLQHCRKLGCTAVDVESAHLFQALCGAIARGTEIRVTPGLFISDVVGGEESLTEKIGGGDAYLQLRPLLRAYFSQVGIDAVYDADGNLHPFAMVAPTTNPELVAAAEAVPDATRQALLGVRLGGEDFPILSAPKRRVDYPDLQSMGGHKHILYVIPPSRADDQGWTSFLARSWPDKLFLAFPTETSAEIVESAKGRGFETIVIVAPEETSFPPADYIVSSDAGWGTYETIVSTHTHAVAVFADPQAHGELLVAMDNRDRGIFVSASMRPAAVLSELADIEVFDG